MQAFQELSPFLLTTVRFTGEIIGRGAYASVEKVEIPGAVCAAKKIHDIFQDHSEVSEDYIQRAENEFVRECQLMTTLRHPHIVQFLGVCYLAGSRFPALVMELLSNNLHDLLEAKADGDAAVTMISGVITGKPFFPLDLKCSILHDIASGLAYLHQRSPPIIHRDLSARNVLLTSAMVAKIADLGVARIVACLRGSCTMSMAPGASVYMPPEAVEAVSKEAEPQRSYYDGTIDIFSFGVITIFILSQSFPQNLTKKGSAVAPTELERRGEYMQTIYNILLPEHPLVHLIQRCLKDDKTLRPDVLEVLDLIRHARDMTEKNESEMDKLELIQALNMQAKAMKVEQLLRSKETQLCLKEANLELRKKLESKQAEISALLEQVAELKEQQNLGFSHKARRQKQHKISSGVNGSNPIQVEQSVQETDFVRQNKLKIVCTARNNASCYANMTRGCAASDQEFAYFAPLGSDTVHRYSISSDKWLRLAPCAYRNFGLVIIKNSLVAVGGRRTYSLYTNRIFTLRDGAWLEEYPPMNYARDNPSVATIDCPGNSEIYVAVVGGSVSDGKWSTSVELYSTSSKAWCELANLPKPLAFPSAAIWSDTDNDTLLISVVGCYREGYSYSFKLDTLKQPVMSSTWSPLPKLPASGLTAVALKSKLVIIGGWKISESVSYIHQLISDQWVKIGAVSNGNECLVVSPSSDWMIIVGGDGTANNVCVFTVIN